MKIKMKMIKMMNIKSIKPPTGARPTIRSKYNNKKKFYLTAIIITIGVKWDTKTVSIF